MEKRGPRLTDQAGVARKAGESHGRLGAMAGDTWRGRTDWPGVK